jgi:hypothetical protein
MRKRSKFCKTDLFGSVKGLVKGQILKYFNERLSQKLMVCGGSRKAASKNFEGRTRLAILGHELSIIVSDDFYKTLGNRVKICWPKLVFLHNDNFTRFFVEMFEYLHTELTNFRSKTKFENINKSYYKNRSKR